MRTSVGTKRTDYNFPLLIVLMAILSYIRLFFLNNVFWDDHCWLQSIYTSNDIFDFLNTGLVELRRVPQGIVSYLILILFKITNHAFVVLHLIIISTQIITPLFLYLLINKLFQNRIAAFIIGSILIIYPIDTTVPVLTTLPYRLGLMFSVISFYLTYRALAEKTRWFYMIIALLLSGLSHYFLVEGTVALEPARLFMIGLIQYNKGYKKNEIIKNSLKYWLPFILLCIPVVLYKLLYKPYGIYAGTYSSDMLFFLKWKRHLYYLAMLLGGNWVYSLVKVEHLSFWSVISGLIALFITYFMLKKNYPDESGFKEIGHIFTCPETKSATKRITMIILLGLLLLVPTVILYEFASRKLYPGFNSRHGCIMQFGHALIVGGALCVIVNKLLNIFKDKKQFIALFMAALLGLGVFFNNLNLDLYFTIWEQEKQFYGAFMERFPALPKNADFLFDIQIDIPLGYSYVLYNAEYPINMLYTESKKPEEFRRHKVTNWNYLNNYKKVGITKYEHLFHWGKDIFDTRELIVIRWKPGEFLVNREIVKKYPQVDYKYIADKDIPLIPSASIYPLRGKVNLFLKK